VPGIDRPVFYYDISSPYAYLAALRVDDVLPVEPVWQPIAFGVLFQRAGKVPWSMREGREQHFDEIARRARERGVPPLVYPDGWPAEKYSLAPLRALLIAADEGKLKDLTLALYRAEFVDGHHFGDPERVLDVAESIGMDREAVREGIASQPIKDRLRAVTEDAAQRGVDGVPTIAVGDRLFWGDDHLEEAAAAISAAA
jgi:2-hydroxychromene-2-carboxylate isomerase